MADGGHVSGEGGGVKGAALGEIFQAVVDLFALFGFARHFSVSGLNSFFLHSQGSVNLNKNQLFFYCLFCCCPSSPDHRGTHHQHIIKTLETANQIPDPNESFGGMWKKKLVGFHGCPD